jgi:hypothetical protein
MTARWAHTYKIIDVEIDHNNFTSDDKAIDRSTQKKAFLESRYSFGAPERAFMTASKWHRDDVASSIKDDWHRKMHRGMQIASGTYKSSPTGHGFYEGNGALLLDTAAFAISGTTAELTGLIDYLDNTFKFKRILAGANDNLYIAWARVGKRGIIKTGTATIVVIAPYNRWLCAPTPLDDENIYKDGSWRQFTLPKKTVPWPKQNDILLTDLKELVQQGEGVKSWLTVDEDFFK